MKKRILFYDSGVGGLTTLKKTAERLSKGHFIYFADDKNCPYGSKSKDEVLSLVEANLSPLIKKFNVGLVVFACNTITTTLISRLREKLKVDIVGTEPAILPAVRSLSGGEVLLIATELTINSQRCAELREAAQKSGTKVKTLAMPTLAEDIEVALSLQIGLNIGYYIELIKKNLTPQTGAIVLGCTHYCFYRGEIENLTERRCFDGNDGVARRVYKMVENRGEYVFRRGRVDIILSSKSHRKRKVYRELLNRL